MNHRSNVYTLVAMDEGNKKTTGGRPQGQTLPLLIVKSPRSTGFSRADEDIPFVSIASLKSNSGELEENLLGASGAQHDNTEDYTAADAAVSNRSNAVSSQSGSPSSRMR